MQLFVHSSFSYCMETLIQAGESRLRVASVDIGVNQSTRQSRLFDSIPEYLWKSGTTILLMYALFRPSSLFCAMGGVLLSFATALALRFAYLIYFTDTLIQGRTHIPSLIVASILFISGAGMLCMAVIAELMRKNRRLLENIQLELRRHDLKMREMADTQARRLKSMNPE